MASSDVMLILPASMEVDWASVRGVTGLATMAPLALVRLTHSHARRSLMISISHDLRKVIICILKRCLVSSSLAGSEPRRVRDRGGGERPLDPAGDGVPAEGVGGGAAGQRRRGQEGEGGRQRGQDTGTRGGRAAAGELGCSFVGKGSM